ncbi:MAG: ABC transporter substrate-binding protein [Syntrophales bacterium]|nr:ABC transporter substrate-binding protein [Syntrophales bacterium]
MAIIGPNASRYALPAARAAEENRIVMITPWATSPGVTLDEMTGLPRRYVFRACFSDLFQGRVISNFILGHLQLKKAAVLFDASSEYNRVVAASFRDHFIRRGGEITAFEGYGAGERNYLGALLRIKAHAPEIIFLPNYYVEVPIQIYQAKHIGLRVPFVGSDSWGTAELLVSCGKACEGYYFVGHYAPEAASPAVRQFVNNYQARYGRVPDDVAALTYDAVGMLARALRQAGHADRETLRDTLAHLSRYEGVTGSISFPSEAGDPVKGAVIMQIQDGRFVWFADVKP